jgi:cytochrome P450
MTTPPLPMPVPGELTSSTIRRYREENGPVFRIELPGKVNAWAVTSYDTVNAVLSDDDIRFSKNPENFTAPPCTTAPSPPDWPLACS